MAMNHLKFVNHLNVLMDFGMSMILLSICCHFLISCQQ